jgi:hypothetical protein
VKRIAFVTKACVLQPQIMITLAHRLKSKRIYKFGVKLNTVKQPPKSAGSACDKPPEREFFTLTRSLGGCGAWWRRKLILSFDKAAAGRA